jgi:hypothetical protein
LDSVGRKTSRDIKLLLHVGNGMALQHSFCLGCTLLCPRHSLAAGSEGSSVLLLDTRSRSLERPRNGTESHLKSSHYYIPYEDKSKQGISCKVEKHWTWQISKKMKLLVDALNLDLGHERIDKKVKNQ